MFVYKASIDMSPKFHYSVALIMSVPSASLIRRAISYGKVYILEIEDAISY